MNLMKLHIGTHVNKKDRNRGVVGIAYVSRYNVSNPYAAELFRIIFHSFEAGIASAICSSKSRKLIIFMK